MMGNKEERQHKYVLACGCIVDQDKEIFFHLCNEELKEQKKQIKEIRKLIDRG